MKNIKEYDKIDAFQTIYRVRKGELMETIVGERRKHNRKKIEAVIELKLLIKQPVEFFL